MFGARFSKKVDFGLLLLSPFVWVRSRPLWRGGCRPIEHSLRRGHDVPGSGFPDKTFLTSSYWFSLDIVVSCLFCWRDCDHVHFKMWTSYDIHAPADQPWKLWHILKLLFVFPALKYCNFSSLKNHNLEIFFKSTQIFNLKDIFSPTWLSVFTNSKVFKWFRRSPLLHNSYKLRCVHF